MTKAVLKRVRKSDEDPYHFTSNEIGKRYPHRKMSTIRQISAPLVGTSDIVSDLPVENPRHGQGNRQLAQILDSPLDFPVEQQDESQVKIV